MGRLALRERAIDALLLALTDFGQGSVMVNGGSGGSKEIDRGPPLVRTEANGRIELKFKGLAPIHVI